MSEGVCEAPTFMEWSAMVVPTCPECGSHAMQVCQHHHQVVRVGDFVGLSETGRTRWCSRLLPGLFGFETFQFHGTLRQRAARALYLLP